MRSFRRYHIGESLIPYTWFTLNRLGVIDKLRNSADTKKYSVQFVSITGKVSQPFYFFQTIKHECAQTWQVVRSEFDGMLIENALAKGVELRRGVSVRDVIMEGSRVVGVRADTKDGAKGEEIRAKVVVDASGRDSLLSRKFGWKDRDKDLNKIAVWSYYKGAKRDPGLDEGATTVAYVPQKGWFWYIPQHSDIVSVGVVGEPGYLYRDTRDPDEIFAREVRDCRWIQERVAVGTQCDQVRVTGEYSVSLEADRRRRLLPRRRRLRVPRSAVLNRRVPGAEERRDGRRHDSRGAAAGEDVSARHFETYLTQQRHAVTSFRNLVTAFYDLSFSFREFLDVYPQLHSLIVDTLVGNVFTDLDPLYNALREDEHRGKKRKSASQLRSVRP